MLYKNNFTIVANWKMNPASYQQAQDLLGSYLRLDTLDKINLIVAPPSIYLGLLSNIYTNTPAYSLSAQNFSALPSGAVTGEISAAMLENFVINYSIIGHSECRANYRESEEIIKQKIWLALQHKIYPIVCIGESRQQFTAGDVVTTQHLSNQLEHIIKAINDSTNYTNTIFIAYEPIWAIGANIIVSDEYIANKCNFILEYIMSVLVKNINCYVLYGGNVSVENIHSLLNIPGLSGVLVGRNALDPIKFGQICQAVSTNIKS